MSRKFVVISILLLFIACGGADESRAVKWISEAELAKSFEGKEPMHVGFDVDDTVLFSSPGFYYGKQKYSPDSSAFLGNPDFWHELNNDLDRYSIPKEIARRLIEMHKKRGDKIFFITARTASKTETLSALLIKTFDLDKDTKVIFTGTQRGKNLKVKPIIDNDIRVYYGDSDSDITAAQKAGIRGIRVIRAGNSTHKPLPQNGALGEEVLRDSMF